MFIIASLAALKASSLCADWFKRTHLLRQKLLMRSDPDTGGSIPLIDRHLKRTTRSATKTQIFVARKLAELCRHVVHTRAFEYVLLQVILSVVHKHRSKTHITKPEVIL